VGGWILCAEIGFNFDDTPGEELAPLPPHQNFA
jgi:hypothetical protein